MRVTLEHVNVAFGERTVLDGVSAELESPGVITLVGPSGSGKSTLLGVIAEQVLPSRGHVKISYADGPGRTDWLVQSTPLLMRRTAIANTMLGPLSTGKRTHEARTQALGALSSLRIEHLANQLAHRLSGGERQRVAVARALATGPSLVLADEPTASLDAHSRQDVCDALIQLGEAGSLVIIATHDPYVASIGKQQLHLDAGRLRLEDAAGG